MSLIPPITKPQPQIAQFECLFKGPLVKDSIVETVNDLLLLNAQFNYEHKIVWVKSEQANYFLNTGDGTDLSHWKKSVSRVVIQQYNSGSTYQTSDTVYLSGKIYSATQDVPIGYNPLSYPAYWTVISGETSTFRYIFQNTTSVIIYTEVRNPQFQICLCTFVTDDDGIIQIDPSSGLAEITNVEYVDASVVRREDLSDNNGKAYEISFYENDELSEQVSGCVNIK